MIDFSNLLFSLIACRIKERRKKKKISAFRFADTLAVDKSDWNKVENCIIRKKKNPYLLSKTLIYRTSDALDITPEELIFGNTEEKENLVKLILLAVLLNKENTNPFLQEKLTDWIVIERQIAPEFENRKDLKLNEEEFTSYINDKYGFWFDKNNHFLYELLNVKYETSIERSSNLLLKLLCSDYAFSSSFIKRLINENSHTIRLLNSIDSNYLMEKGANETIEEFVLNKGNYSNLILDYYSKDYKLFILAFNSFWRKYKSFYFDFFQKNLFSKVINPPFMFFNSWGGEEYVTDKVGELISDIDLALKKYPISKLKLTTLKTFNNQLLVDLINSTEFIELSEHLLFASEYRDSKSMLSNLGIQTELLRAYESSRFIDRNNNPKDTKCISSIIKATELALHKRFK